MTVSLNNTQFERFIEEQKRHMIRTSPPETMDVETLSIFLSRSPDIVYEKVALGTIPFHKDGKRLYFLRDEIREWQRGNRD